MASTMNQSNNLSSNYGEGAVHRVNVLASCYLVDAAAHLKGIHYCTTGATADHFSQGRSGIPEVPSSGIPSPPTSPPLAALTSSNELAFLPKQKKRDTAGYYGSQSRSRARRGGAAFSIREECERFFCETMKTAFLGERTPSMNGSGLTGASHVLQLQTPPPDDQFPFPTVQNTRHRQQQQVMKGHTVDAWLEIWDYAGGASFRAFVANDGREKSLFVFFDVQGVMGRDLKKALMALIELADGPLGCAHVVTCIDRLMLPEEAVELTKSLQWVGFELIALDKWAHALDALSDKWVFMGMEV